MNKPVKVNYVLFDLTNKCNLLCKHSYKTNNITDKELDSDFCLSIFDELHRLYGTNNIVLSGGEPSLYSSLKELLDGIKHREASVKFNTNGLILPPPIVDQPYKNMRVQISLDGYDRKSYKEIRGLDAFDKVCENAVQIKSAGLNVSFRTTITKTNISNYMDFIELSEKLGIPIIMRPLMNTGVDSQSELANSFEELINWKDEVIARGLIKYIGGEDFFTCTNCPLLCEESYISVLSVDVHGNAFPCSALRTDYLRLGNFYESSVRDVIENYYDVRDRIERVIRCEQCKKCGFRSSYGKGNCIVFCSFANKKCVLELMDKGI